MNRRTIVLLALTARLALSAAATVSAAVAQPAQSSVASCDRGCLTRAMGDFLKAMTTGATGTVPLVEHAEVRENANVIPLTATVWRSMKAIRSVVTFADPITGNVVSRAGVELTSGKPGYVSTRLKIVSSGRIADVELSAIPSSSRRLCVEA